VLDGAAPSNNNDAAVAVNLDASNGYARSLHGADGPGDIGLTE
jgi:hypothetical protein